MLDIWTPGVLLRGFDVFAARRAAMKQRLENARLAQALEQQAGVPLTQQQKIALLQSSSAGHEHAACCQHRGPGCESHHH